MDKLVLKRKKRQPLDEGQAVIRGGEREMKMETLTLIHTKDKFKIKIGDKEIPNILGYSITSNAKDVDTVNLSLDVILDVGEISISGASLVKDQGST